MRRLRSSTPLGSDSADEWRACRALVSYRASFYSVTAPSRAADYQSDRWLLMGIGESNLRFDQPDDMIPWPPHVVVHVVIRGFETRSKPI
jgi:hypothetical protein